MKVKFAVPVPRVIVVALLLALSLCIGLGNFETAHAAGNPPGGVTIPAPGGIDFLHGGTPKLKAGVVRTTSAAKAGVSPLSTVTPTTPVLFIHGMNDSGGKGGGALKCNSSGGVFTNTLAYLRNTTHPGLGDVIDYRNALLYTIGYYNGDTNCTNYISTRDPIYGNFWAPACDGLLTTWGTAISNSDPTVGTNDEPIEHVACELGWFIYNNFTSQGTNVKIVAHSMGGLVVRYMIEQVQLQNGHFPATLYVSDVVTFSTPHGGLNATQELGYPFTCGYCAQANQMGESSYFILDIRSHDHPNASTGTDWTLIGSRGLDPLDWDYQASFMSNTPGNNHDNHRIGYNIPDHIPACAGQPGWPNGYDHGDYMNDQCDAYDAGYYYCDGCSRDKHTNFSYSASSPHSLHEMLLAFIYYDW